jgi:ATP-dependent DNA ligase
MAKSPFPKAVFFPSTHSCSESIRQRRALSASRGDPAIYIAFDLLADEDGSSLLELTRSERRPPLEKFAGKFFATSGRIRLSPATPSLAQAKAWLVQGSATLDGIIAKRRDLAYRSGERDGMQKIKSFRTADCVVGGFRYGKGKKTVGSLLLGLYDEKDLLHHVGLRRACLPPTARL